MARARFLAAAATATSIPPPTLPEVLVAGRANVGKSTLLGAVLGSPSLVRTSKKAGHTRSLNFFNLSDRLIVVDAPGYGTRGRPEWGALFDKFVEERKTLRRILLLVNASHGVKEVDQLMLEHLKDKLSKSGGRFEVQVVLTKVDALLDDKGERADAVLTDLAREFTLDASLPCLATSIQRSSVGVERVREAIAHACGLERWPL